MEVCVGLRRVTQKSAIVALRCDCGSYVGYGRIRETKLGVVELWSNVPDANATRNSFDSDFLDVQCTDIRIF